MVKAISIEAYRKHIESGKARAQWVKIYAHFSGVNQWYTPNDFCQQLTRSEIAHQSGIRLSSVCGRVNELIQAGLIVEYPRRNCVITGEPAHPVGLVQAFRLVG